MAPKTPRIRVNNIQFFDEHPILRGGNRYLPHAEGIVIYEIELADGTIEFIEQAFSEQHGGMTESGVFIFEKYGGAVDRNVFSLRPMFVYVDPKKGIRFGLYHTQGMIHLDPLLSDMEVDKRAS